MRKFAFGKNPVRFNLTGKKELEANIKGMAEVANKGTLTKILMKHAQPIADDAASRAPKRTGTLARSAGVSTRLSPRQSALHKPVVHGKNSTEVFVGYGPLPQAIIMEFGSIYVSPRPSLRPAWESGKNRMYVNIQRDLFSHIIRRIKSGKLPREMRAQITGFNR
jgi:HK97 gp10 family phage protein